jgi:hypothetical protein
MKTQEEIYNLYLDRRHSRGPMIARMEEIRNAYNGDLAIPLVELNAYERSAVPNLVAQGIDQTATRIASTIPNIQYPVLRPGVKFEEENARKRRAANLGWWEQNNMELKLRRRARWLQGYACAPVCIRPSSIKNIPCWYVRDPLSCYPAPDADPDTLTPENVIFAFKKSIRWVQSNYPMADLRRKKSTSPDTPITILEYMDADQITLIALSSDLQFGQDHNTAYQMTSYGAFSDEGYVGSNGLVTLENAVNLAQICPAVIPGRITLDREQGQYDGIIGMYQSQSMLFALNFRAVAQDVWPDQWLISEPGRQAKIVKTANGRTGQIGEIVDGKIDSIHLNPGYKADQLISYLERNQRVTAGIPAEFGGESPSNVRTGRRGDSILSAVVDFPIQEAQTLLAKSLEAENRVAVAIDKAYYGNERKSFYVSWRGAKGTIDYIPNKIFTTDQNRVFFPAAGVDANNLVITTGQMIGTGMMSTRTAMEIHPFIDDAEEEQDRITVEGLKRALQASIETQANQGLITPDMVAKITQLVASGKEELAEAVLIVQREFQELQASQAPPGDPSLMPGIAQPGMGAEATPAVPEVEPSASNLAAVLGSLYPAQAAMANNG